MPRVAWDELSLHRWLARALEGDALAAGLGNDAAVLARALRRPVLCVDQLVEGVHCVRGTPPARMGRKACARALSDLAASAARPRAVLAALRAPGSADERALRALLRGVARCAADHGAALVGGDITRGSGALSLAVTAAGELEAPRPVSRAAARPGDVVVATGAFGGSALGRHLRIAPRLAEGVWLARCGARAMMDVSDGLGIDLARLARASGVRLELERVPVHPDARRAARRDGRAALEHALADGEDHELVAALPRRALPRARREAPRRCPSLAVIGRVLAGSGLHVPASEEPGSGLRRWDPREGWVHRG
jgi:thiamine-monophosphate kinase